MPDGVQWRQEPEPTVTPLRGPGWEVYVSVGPESDPGASMAHFVPEGFEEVLQATRADVGLDGFAYDGTIMVATNLNLDSSGNSVAIALSPLPYSCILASRRYGEIHSYENAPYRPAISSVLLKTADDLWILGQRSATVDISKGRVGFSAGGFVHPELPEQRDAFRVAALRELEEELGVRGQDLFLICPNVLITSWRKVEISYQAKTLLTLEEVRGRTQSAEGRDEHQRIIGTAPEDYQSILDCYGTWPGVREALAEARTQAL